MARLLHAMLVGSHLMVLALVFALFSSKGAACVRAAFQSVAAACAIARSFAASSDPLPSTNSCSALPGVSASTAGEPSSATRPDSSTMIESQSIMVWRRCAIVSTVPVKSVRVLCWRCLSVCISTFAVASSISITAAFRRSARAMHSNCLCPTLRLPPPSVTWQSTPPP